MTRLVLMRTAQAIPLVLLILTISFIVTNVLPADPALQVAGPLATAEEVDETRVRLGLDRPLAEQYFEYMGDLLRGDLGRSIVTDRPVADELIPRLGATALLVTLGTVAATAFGVAVGAVAALGGFARRPARWFSSLGLAMPDFVLGLVLIFVFFYTLRWAPPPLGQIGIGETRPERITGAVVVDALLSGQWGTFVAATKQLVLPVATLALVYGAPIAKIAEGSFQTAAAEPFVDYARLSGLGRVRTFSYIARSAMPPILTLSGAVYGYLLGGVVMVELVFSWDGAASYAAKAVLERDVPTIQAFILFAAIATIFIYIALDVVYAILDPRADV